MNDDRMPGAEPPDVPAPGAAAAPAAGAPAPAGSAAPAAGAPAASAAATAPAPGAPAAQVEPPSEDVALAGTATLPGEHRGGFQRQFTEPVPVTASVHTDPDSADVQWAPAPPAPLPHSAGWALTFAVLGLIVSFLVGWGFLIGLVGMGLAIAALRRPWESRAIAAWALCLSILSLVYSGGWLWWASTQGPLFD